ncbi:MAG TPA: hypothetical protein VF821_29340 [Lentzea sp.]
MIARDHPREQPVAVVRVGGGREEMFVHPHRWVTADPEYREWFVNVPISDAEADVLTTRMGRQVDIEDRDPRSSSERMAAVEGYNHEYLYFAVETEEHPFDDPLTVVREHLIGAREVWSYTRDLVWREVPVEGRLARITAEDAHRFEEVQARRVFGDTDVRHYAVVNQLYPEPTDPCVLIRELIDAEGMCRYETCDENRRWVTTGRQHHCGKPVTGAQLDHLLTSWSPRPLAVEDRYYAYVDDDGKPVRLAHLSADEDGHVTEKSFVTYWSTGEKVLDEAYRRVEVDAAEVGELEELLLRDQGPADGGYRYWAVVDPLGGMASAYRIMRSWGGDDSTRQAELFYRAGDTWYRSQTLGEVLAEHAVEISAEQADELRRTWLDRRSS